VKRSPGSRKAASLPELTHQRLNMYALAAAASGASLLALVQPAEGKIIYRPANIQLMNQNQVFLDMNHDGTNDFSFYGMSVSRRSISTFGFRLTASPAAQGNGIWGMESNEHTSCAARVQKGTRIGQKRRFESNRVVLFDWSGGPNGGTAYCPWAGKNGTAYLGLKFTVKGKTHFGWARLKVEFFNGAGVVLTGYAYETIANKAIVAGATADADASSAVLSPVPRPAPASEPVTLGTLAMGFPRIAIWRREESASELR